MAHLHLFWSTAKFNKILLNPIHYINIPQIQQPIVTWETYSRPYLQPNVARKSAVIEPISFSQIWVQLHQWRINKLLWPLKMGYY